MYFKNNLNPNVILKVKNKLYNSQSFKTCVMLCRSCAASYTQEEEINTALTLCIDDRSTSSACCTIQHRHQQHKNICCRTIPPSIYDFIQYLPANEKNVHAILSSTYTYTYNSVSDQTRTVLTSCFTQSHSHVSHSHFSLSDSVTHSSDITHSAQSLSVNI